MRKETRRMGKWEGEGEGVWEKIERKEKEWMQRRGCRKWRGRRR